MLCLVCKKERSKRNRYYCSKECFHIGHVGFKHSPESKRVMAIVQSKNKTGRNIKCKTCKKQFYVSGKRLGEAKFCSKKCSFLHKRGRPNIKLRKRVDKVCKTCKKKYWVILAREKVNNYCSKKCKNLGQSIVISGKNNPNWHDGARLTKYGKGWTKLTRSKIKLRDKNKCSMCHGIARIPTVHHIDYDKNNNLEYNLITLCASCHCKTNFNRKHWIKYFKKIMINKYGNF